ncbi:hypothetical protein P3T65_26300 [Pseudomonas nitroreducens]|uniref:hypothetical protein n=1 Tax=Pseudomonas nitroreducens TaxID=46680 RepID=UPI0023F82BBF|nr:hypothetical protein [Pseudomonas nitroreducens]WEW97700.1 hypothetical protein P3T65_26300 [Pseudomonas nitroreducens]
MRCTECDYVRRPGEFGPGRDIGRCPECGAYYHQQKRAAAAVKPKPKAKSWIILAGFLALLGGMTYLLLPKPAAPVVAKPEQVVEPRRPASYLNVPSDPKGRYTVLAVDQVDYSHVQIETLREGAGGRTYSRRLVDCGQAKIMYLGTGETLQEMLLERPDPGMAPIEDGSIAFYVAQRACRDSPLRKYTLD